MKNGYFQACCRQWLLGTQESDLQPIPTLLLAQQAEIRSHMLGLIFKTYSNMKNLFHFSHGPESGAADQGPAQCARGTSSPGVAHVRRVHR